MNGVAGKKFAAASAAGLSFGLAFGLAVCLLTAAGCSTGPQVLAVNDRYPIDRSKVEYPAGYDFERLIVNLTGPTAITFDADGDPVVAEGGTRGSDVRILKFRLLDRTVVQVYPAERRLDLPLLSAIPTGGFKMYGPVGDLIYHDGWLYVSHRDDKDFGVITRLNDKGEHQTVTAGWPAQGEHGIAGMAIDAKNGRLYFGVGSATNSGVVGPDDREIGWLQNHPAVHDLPWQTVVLVGRRMNSRNPKAPILFGQGEVLVSAGFQQYGVSDQTRIPGVVNSPGGVPKFNAGLFSVPLTGGDYTVEAHGIRYARGMAFDPQYGRLFFTNNGMELRGSRPIKDDPDAVLMLGRGGGVWYGWPDHSTDLFPIDRDELRRMGGFDPDRFQPPLEYVRPTGYPDVAFLINHKASGLVVPSRDLVLNGVFPSQSGAAGIEFVPLAGRAADAFKEYAGSAIVALSGDRAPFATGGIKVGPIGYKVMRVDVDGKQVREFIRNTQGKPRSLQSPNDADLIERPIQARFGPDGSLYVLDFGQMRMKGGKEAVESHTGKVYRLKPTNPPVTPTAAPAAGPATEPTGP